MSIGPLCLGLQQLGQPRDGLGHPASFVPGQILGHHRHLMVVLAVDIGDVVIVAVVDPIAPGVSVTVHGGVKLRGGFRSSRGGVLDVVIGDLIVGLEMFEVGGGLIEVVELAEPCPLVPNVEELDHEDTPVSPLTHEYSELHSANIGRAAAGKLGAPVGQ